MKGFTLLNSQLITNNISEDTVLKVKINNIKYVTSHDSELKLKNPV